MKVGSSPPYICVNMGFKGKDITKLGATKSNFWILRDWQVKECETWNFVNKDEKPHCLYVSFPSLKDKEHDPGPDFMHTGECVTFVPYEAFEEYEKIARRDRP